MKKKIIVFAACATALCCFAFSADAQQPGKIFRIGFLDT